MHMTLIYSVHTNEKQSVEWVYVTCEFAKSFYVSR